jgi:DNA-directed RNA polymerase specialized sigma24 family protein
MTVIPPPGCPRADAAGGPAGDAATQAFADHRELLFCVVYSLLGSVTDTEDVLQDTWRSWTCRRPDAGAAGGAAARPRAGLVRTAARLALSRLGAMRRRRAAYIGPWLPEPLVRPIEAAPAAAGPGPAAAGPDGGPAPAGPDGGGAGAGRRAEPAPLATMVILESLTEAERAVFVLGEVAGCAPAEIAGILGCAPAAVRDLARRAGARVAARRPPRQADPRVRQGITARFAAAMLSGDRDAFARLLAPEVSIWTDSGGKAAAAALSGVHRRDQAARLLAAGGYRPRAGAQVTCRRVNGDLSLVVTAGGAPYAVLVLDLEPQGGQVCGIYAVTNPDKLGRVA